MVGWLNGFANFLNRRLVAITGLLALSAAGLLLPGCAANQPQYRLKLPDDVGVGDLSGPGSEALSKALNRRLGAGPVELLLSGQTSFTYNLTNEQETVPEIVPAGPPETVYKPDEFTGRLWKVEERPMATETRDYALERAAGQMIFEWRLSQKKSGAVLETGRTQLNLDRTYGGYLAHMKLAPPMTPSEAKAMRETEAVLADHLAHSLMLDLGREPTAWEVETAADPQSREAKRLADAGNWDKAREIWLDILRQNPEFAPALYNLGLYEERGQKPEEAWRYYRAAFLSHGDARHRAALTRLTEWLRRENRLPERD